MLLILGIVCVSERDEVGSWSLAEHGSQPAGPLQVLENLIDRLPVGI